MSMELINTSIEVVIDKVSPKFNVFAMMGKDIAAGGVLISAVGAVIVGIVLFGDFEKIGIILNYFISTWYRLVILAISIVLAVLFIGNTKKRGGNAAKIKVEKEK